MQRFFELLKRLILFVTCKKAILLYGLVVVAGDSCYLWHSDAMYDYVITSALAGYILLQVAFGFLFWYAVLLLSSRSLIASVLLLFPIVSGFVIEKYGFAYYRVKYDTLVETAFNATGGQITVYMGSTAICSIIAILCTVLIFALSALFRKATKGDRFRAFGLFLVSVLIPLITCKGHVIGMPDAAYMLSTYKSVSDHWGTWVGQEVIKEKDLSDNSVFRMCVDREKPENIYLPFHRENTWINAAIDNYFPPVFRDSSSAPSECTLGEGEGATVVLYFVESYRADHSPFGGYHRNTSPLLYGKCRDNIIVLPHVRSFGTHTIQSIYGTLSDACEENREASVTSFQSIFRKHHFNCLLLENNAFGSAWVPRPIFRSLLKDSYDEFVLVKNDNNFVPITSKRVDQSNRNMFIIYDGSYHHPFDTATGKVWGDSLIDRYDETRLGIDKAAYDFIKSIEDKPAIVLIVGDHGESFGEGGRICHGGSLSAKEQRHVFALIWYSDAYAKQFPEIIAALKENAEAFNSQDCIFHTMPSLGGIRSELQNRNLDMTIRRSEQGRNEEVSTPSRPSDPN